MPAVNAYLTSKSVLSHNGANFISALKEKKKKMDETTLFFACLGPLFLCFEN